MKPLDFLLSQPWAMSPDHVRDVFAMAESASTTPIEAVAAKAGRPMDGAERVSVRDGVAIVPVRGMLTRYDDFWCWLFGGTSIETLAKDFRAALDNQAVRAIVMDIDSPGGQASGISEFAAQIRAGCAIKPVEGYAGNMAASGGYWLLAACDRATIGDTGLLGSIGVVQGVSLPRKDKDGMARSIEFVSSQSPMKRPNPETEAGKAEIQSQVDATAEVFINAVSKYRKVKPAKVMSDFGAGGMKVGKAAVDAGMADRIGDLESLISELSRGARAGKSPSYYPHGAGAVAKTIGFLDMKVPFATIFGSWLSKGQPDEIDTDEIGAVSAPVVKPVTKVEFYERATGTLLNVSGKTDADIERMVAERAEKLASEARRKDKIAEATTAGLAWVASMVKAEKLKPSEANFAAAKYTAFAAVDIDAPVKVTVDGAAETFSVLGMFKAEIEGRKPANLTTETVPTDAAAVQATLGAAGLKVLDNQAAHTSADDAAKAVADRQRREMLAGSEAGREILAASK